MNQAKIRLSPKEMELVINADWILTKNGIMNKAMLVLASFQESQQQVLLDNQDFLPPGATKTPPKISKGENYKGLPYMVLDYPRLFEKNNTLAIRTLFWWGNFFSCTLHLSGSYKQRFEEIIRSSYDYLKEENYFICIHEDEWEHHFAPDYYTPIGELTNEEFVYRVSQKAFIKLAQKYPLELWDDIQEILPVSFRDMIRLLAGQLPSR